MLSAGQRAERYEPFNIRRERRVSSSHFVRSAEYRRRNDFPRLGRNTLERNVLCRAVRGNVFQRTPVSSSADSQARRDTLPFVAEDRFKMASAAFLAV